MQFFVDNVLNPGVPGWRPFVEAVFGSLADLFPSPWLHVGGDELPARHVGWVAGGGHSALAGAQPRRAFLRDLIELVVFDDGPAGRRLAGSRR